MTRERMPDYPPEFDDEQPIPEVECESMMNVESRLRERVRNGKTIRDPLEYRFPDDGLGREAVIAQASIAAALWFIASKMSGGQS